MPGGMTAGTAARVCPADTCWRRSAASRTDARPGSRLDPSDGIKRRMDGHEDAMLMEGSENRTAM